MGDNDQDALIGALRPFVERYGREPIEQALTQIAPRKQGRPKGTTKYLEGDKVLMLAAYDEYLRMHVRFHRDPAGRHPKPTTYRALKFVAEEDWADPEHPERRGYAAPTPKAIVARLRTRFKKPEPASPTSKCDEDFRDEIERLEAEQAAFLADLDSKVVAEPSAEWFRGSPWNAEFPARRAHFISEHLADALLRRFAI